MFESTSPQIMGILNVTPDSFSDGGKYTNLTAAICQAETMIAEGADIIDIGGESTRPGSLPVSSEAQIQRVVPVISELRRTYPNLLISIDTRSAKVAAAALQAGATIINDISAGIDDPAMLPLTAATRAPIILMHMQGSPETMQSQPYYADVIAEIKNQLQARIDTAITIGVKPENIVIDPGIGFGKRKQDNLAILAHLEQFVAMGYPVLLGTSRKRFMGNICNITQPEELMTATAVTTALGILAGVTIFRVHDIKANRQAADVAWAIKQSS